jgi:hypothetical protein
MHAVSQLDGMCAYLSSLKFMGGCGNLLVCCLCSIAYHGMYHRLVCLLH